MSARAVNVVVGGASGMGEAVAAAFVERGPLLIADREVDAARVTAERLGPNAEAVECDIADDAQIAALGARVEQLGSLVVTAGLSPQMAPGRTIYAVNLVGMAKVLAALEPAVGPGSVAVCFASIAGHSMTPPPAILDALDDPLAAELLPRLTEQGANVDDSDTAYVFSKIGVMRMVRRLAPAWGALGGRIVSVSPGVIDTSMGRGAVDAMPHLESAVKSWPVPRLGRPDEIAAVVSFLCSDGASYITGSDVLVDGGSVGWSPPTRG
jgi:NAD(P)-dependent dehydrogenase (short-subunit alcohol dehydrogenase family)